MAADTKIQWTDHTFNPWWGCTAVSPACDFCYAELLSKRTGKDLWGPGKPRMRTKGPWKEILKWNRNAPVTGKRKVFVASMADFWDNEVPDEWRNDALDVIRQCTNLRFQILSKRIGNAAKMMPDDWEENFKHCGLMATVVTQQEVDRDLPKLLRLKEERNVTWVGISVEPQIEAIDLKERFWKRARLDWCITGGESGAYDKVRPYSLEWARSLIRQCQSASTAIFVKQLGRKPFDQTIEYVDGLPVAVSSRDIRLKDGHGGDWNEWPESLRVREFPAALLS